MVDAKKIEFEFKKYMDMYKADPELGRLMQQMTFQELFNEKFMKENSKFTSMDDMLFKSDFGLTNPLEIEKVNAGNRKSKSGKMECIYCEEHGV